MSNISPEARALLKILVTYLPHVTVRGDRVQNCPSYTEILKQVVPSWIPSRGDNAGLLLKTRGLDGLAEWTKVNGYPAITGIIVRQETNDPGEGYYKLIENTQLPAWHENIRQAQNFDWQRFL